MEGGTQVSAALLKVQVLVVGRRTPLCQRQRQQSVGAPERFQSNRATVTDFGQQMADLRPVQMPSSQVTAVILVGLEMDQIRGGPSYRSPKVVFLHIHVESIEHYLDSRAADLVNQLDGLAGRVTKVRFESIERLDGEFHPILRRVVTGLLESCDHPLNPCQPMRLIDDPGRAAGKDQRRTVNRASNDFRAGGGGDLDATP